MALVWRVWMGWGRWVGWCLGGACGLARWCLVWLSRGGVGLGLRLVLGGWVFPCASGPLAGLWWALGDRGEYLRWVALVPCAVLVCRLCR